MLHSTYEVVTKFVCSPFVASEIDTWVYQSLFAETAALSAPGKQWAENQNNKLKDAKMLLRTEGNGEEQLLCVK